jgi:hypothetical protein
MERGTKFKDPLCIETKKRSLALSGSYAEIWIPSQQPTLPSSGKGLGVR